MSVLVQFAFIVAGLVFWALFLLSFRVRGYPRDLLLVFAMLGSAFLFSGTLGWIR